MTDGIVRTLMGHYVVADDQVLAEYVRHFGTFEFPDNLRDLRSVAHLIPEGGVVVDAGACIGDHTCTYSQLVGINGTVHAFEPHPESYRALVKNTERFTNVVTHRLALGSGPISGRLAFLPNVGASFLGDDAGPSAVVTMTTLDVALAHLGRLDFIHLDAEGSEPEILRGAETLIAKFKPAMLIEVADTWLKRYDSSEPALLSQIASYGYRLSRIQTSVNEYDVIAEPIR